MKRLTLLRHAKSSWDETGIPDHDRPLAKRGLRNAPRMGKRLARRGVKPDLILSSSAKRARQTAELIEPALKHATLVLRADPQIYLASPGKLLALVAGIDDAVDELILVGHNPGFTQLANMLLPDLSLMNLPTAGAVGIDCEIESWAEIDSGRRGLRFYDFPKNPEPV